MWWMEGVEWSGVVWGEIVFDIYSVYIFVGLAFLRSQRCPAFIFTLWPFSVFIYSFHKSFSKAFVLPELYLDCYNQLID